MIVTQVALFALIAEAVLSLGALLGFGLGFAARRFAVETAAARSGMSAACGVTGTSLQELIADSWQLLACSYQLVATSYSIARPNFFVTININPSSTEKQTIMPQSYTCEKG